MLGLGIGIGIGSTGGAQAELARAADITTLVLNSLILPDRNVPDGVLIKSTAAVWFDIIKHLENDWTQAFQIPARKWEELVAGALERQGYEVILTPPSGDFGRDVIATKGGVGSVKILGSVKAYAPHRNVSYDDIRALLGVMSLDPAATKGLITTTSDFPPRIQNDPIWSVVPAKLELINGAQLPKWLSDSTK